MGAKRRGEAPAELTRQFFQREEVTVAHLCRCRLIPYFREKIVSKEFMRKYIHIAKAVTPVLTEEAANHIAEEYARLRSQEQMGADIARVSSSEVSGLKSFRQDTDVHASYNKKERNDFWPSRSSLKYLA